MELITSLAKSNPPHNGIRRDQHYSSRKVLRSVSRWCKQQRQTERLESYIVGSRLPTCKVSIYLPGSLGRISVSDESRYTICTFLDRIYRKIDRIKLYRSR